ERRRDPCRGRAARPDPARPVRAGQGVRRLASGGAGQGAAPGAFAVLGAIADRGDPGLSAQALSPRAMGVLERDVPPWVPTASIRTTSPAYPRTSGMTAAPERRPSGSAPARPGSRASAAALQTKIRRAFRSSHPSAAASFDQEPARTVGEIEVKVVL